LRLKIPIALTIAGSDSISGAGVEADLKTFTSLGVYGVVALTGVTAQNTTGVKRIYDLPPDIVVDQVMAIWEDTGIDAGKTGMLRTSGIVEAVANTVEKLGFPLIVDPVIYAKDGTPLLKQDAIEVFKEKLIPLAKVVTPNRFEAEILTGIQIKNIEDARKAAKILVDDMGAEAAIVKGGHLEAGDIVVDILYYNNSFHEFKSRRLTNICTHGAGCVYSAAITAYIAKGYGLLESVKSAKEYMDYVLEHSVKIGRGYCPVNSTSKLLVEAEKYNVLDNLIKAYSILVESNRKIREYAINGRIWYTMTIDPLLIRRIDEVAVASIDFNNRDQGLLKIDFGTPVELAVLTCSFTFLNPVIRSIGVIKHSEDTSWNTDLDVMDLSMIKHGSNTCNLLDLSNNTGGEKGIVLDENKLYIIDLGFNHGVKAIVVTGRDAVDVAHKIARLVDRDS